MEQTKKKKKKNTSRFADYKRNEWMGQHVTRVDREAIRSVLVGTAVAKSKPNGTR